MIYTYPQNYPQSYPQKTRYYPQAVCVRLAPYEMYDFELCDHKISLLRKEAFWGLKLIDLHYKNDVLLTDHLGLWG